MPRKFCKLMLFQCFSSLIRPTPSSQPAQRAPCHLAEMAPEVTPGRSAACCRWRKDMSSCRFFISTRITHRRCVLPRHWHWGCRVIEWLTQLCNPTAKNNLIIGNVQCMILMGAEISRSGLGTHFSSYNALDQPPLLQKNSWVPKQTTFCLPTACTQSA